MTSDKSVIYVLSAANFVIGMGGFMVVGLIPPFADAFDITTAQAGWLVTAYALSYALISPLLVSLTGRIGRRRILACGLLIFGLSCLLAASANSPTLVYGARLLSALGAGLVTPIAAAVAAGLSTPERQGRMLATVFAGLTFAQVIGVPLGGWLAFTFGWRSAFIVVFALSLPVVWAIWTRVPAGLSFAPVTLTALGATLSNPRLVFAVGYTALLMCSTYILYTYIAPLLTETMSYGRDGVSLVLLLFGVGAVIGNILGGQMTDRVGATRWLLIMTVLLSGVNAAYSALPLPHWILCVLSVAWSTLGFSFMSAQQSRLIALAPERTQVLLALNASAIYVGAACGAAIGAIIIDLFGVGGLGLAGGAMGLIAAASLLPRQSSRAPG